MNLKYLMGAFSVLAMTCFAADSPELARLKKIFDEQKVKTGSEFSIRIAEDSIAALKKISNDTTATTQERSEAIRVAGGFEGKIAETLGIKGGLAHAKLSMQDFKTAIQLDPHNADAYYDYGATIQGMGAKSRLVRKFLAPMPLIS